MVALSAGVAEAVPTSPFLPTRESSLCAMCTCLPSAAAPRPRPFRCGPGFTHHSLSRLRSEAEHPEGLALTGSGTLRVPAREAASFCKFSSRTCLQRVSCSFVHRTLDNTNSGEAQRGEELVQGVIEAIQQLQSVGQRISVSAIAKLVHLSPAALYRYPKVKLILEDIARRWQQRKAIESS